MSYFYASNIDSLDRRTQLEFQLDNGDTAILRLGHFYDLSASELQRARQYIVLTSSTSPSDEDPIGVVYLPMKGNPTNGQVPLFDTSQGAFVPGSVSGLGGAVTVPFTPTGTVAAVNVQAAVAEVSADVVSVGSEVAAATVDVAVIKEAPLNVDESRFAGSLQAALDHLPTNGGDIIVPNTAAPRSGPIVVAKSGVTIRGDGKFASRLTASAGEDVITFADALIQDVRIEDVGVEAPIDGGHCFSQLGSLSYAKFLGVHVVQLNPAKRIYDFSTGAGSDGYINNLWGENFKLEHPTNGTVNPFYLRSVGGFANVDAWVDGIIEGGGRHFFFVEEESGSTHVSGLLWRNITTEFVNGGFAKVLSGFAPVFENIHMYDFEHTGSIADDLIVVGKGSGPGLKTSNPMFLNVCRYGGTLAAGKYDIKLLAGEVQRAVAINCARSSGNGYKVDAGGNGLYRIGLEAATIDNDTANLNFDVPETWIPGHNNLKIANTDPALLTGGTTLTAGTVYLVKVPVPHGVPLANLWSYVTTVGVTLTASQNFAGVYDPADGSLIAKTADLSAVWNSTGAKSNALTAEAGKSLSIPGGRTAFIYIAFLSNGTTPPTLLRFPTPLPATANLGLTAPDGYRGATADTGRTTLPSTLGAITPIGTIFWGGAS